MDLRNSMHGGVDRITNLPDSLIHHIISFLEIKHVARTCVLSKSWKYIWTSVPTLDFLSLYPRHRDTPNKEEETKEFMDIVDRVLHLHDTTTSLQKFSLRWMNTSILDTVSLDTSRVNLWISAAILRKVQELSLTFSARKTFCPLSLFTCQSLITLELNISYDFYIPKHMSFPKLKHLKLGGVKFRDEHKNDLLSSLSLSNCPVLEDLTMECCVWIGVRNFCISAPSLLHLKIINDPYLWDRKNYSDYSACYLKSRPGLRNSGLNIHAPRLLSLTYKNTIPKGCVISSSLTLVEADVDDVCFGDNYIYHATREQRIGVGAAAIRFLRVLSHVKVLSIARQLLKALSFADDLIKVLPAFNNLKQLNVSAAVTDGKTLVALFQSAPSLECLIFNKIVIFPTSYGNEDDYNNGYDGLELTSGCCFLHLKSVCFKEFTGENREMWWAKLILEKAKALQQMTISHSLPYVFSYTKRKTKEEVKAEVSNLLRASATTCVLNFS